MASTIPAHDREHFAAVQRALLDDGLHLAMVSSDRLQLTAYAGALARALAQAHGWRVEAYQPKRLEAIVAELMLRRFDAALSGISAPSPGLRSAQSHASEERGCVLFLPHAQALPLQEFDQLLRIAAGTRLLRVVALFDGAASHETGLRLRALGERVACWTLDEDDDDPPPVPHRAPGTAGATLPAPRPSRLRTGGMLAVAAVLLLALLPAAPWRPGQQAEHAGATSTLTVRGSVQLAGEPPAGFRPAPGKDGTDELPREEPER